MAWQGMAFGYSWCLVTYDFLVGDGEKGAGCSAAKGAQ